MFSLSNATARLRTDLWGAWNLPSWSRQANAICAESESLQSKSDDQLRQSATELSWETRSGNRTDKQLNATFSLVREAARRVHHQPHYEVQVLAGVAISHGMIAEMQTGEGKTLAALLPAFWQALSGAGCHLVTANDYLAARDAQFARPVFQMLGLSVGCVTSELERDDRREQYACDVTYGTAKEFGFDFLRDRMMRELGERPVQRGHHAAIVDEADSVLIDDARTPLLISAAAVDGADMEEVARWCATAASQLTAEVDFVSELKLLRARLTNSGCRRLMRRQKPPILNAIGVERVFEQVEHAITARQLLQADRDYLVDEQTGVGIVDTSTGRIAVGRRWRNGLHQAVEVKEGVAISESIETAARVSVQRFFQRYQSLGGLTGTAMAAASEFQRDYKLQCVAIPTRLPCQRVAESPRVFRTATAKHLAIVDDVKRRSDMGQPILIGTPSVASSEMLSAILTQRGLAHEVLNCRRFRQEADIISHAGERGRITIATNMAGRGTDIRVGPDVLELGGLHVIATQRHSNDRIDRQLIGRTARQGEPGSYQFFVSLDDELLQNDKPRTKPITSTHADNDELPAAWIKLFDQAQQRRVQHHSRQRRDLLQREKDHDRKCRDMGLDPLLDVAVD